MAAGNASFFAQLGNVMYGGIRADIPGHGGAKCVAYLSRSLMVADTTIASIMMITVLIYALKTYTLPRAIKDDGNPLTKRVLLVLIAVLFGIELGYKICSRQMLYIMNPCHVITAVEASCQY